MISLNIATHKAREPFLRACLESIEKQNTLPDVVNICFNDVMPYAWLNEIKLNINALIPAEDTGAAGKFANVEKQKSGVYITIDDDLIADKGYIGYMADMAYLHPDSIVGLHGSRYAKYPIESYYNDNGRLIFYCYHEKRETGYVDMLGTGAIATCVKNAPQLNQFAFVNATDPSLCFYAHKHNIPLICLQRAHGFVKEQPGSQDSAIWKTVAKDDSEQTKIINSIGSACWVTDYIYKKPQYHFGDASIEWGHIKAIASVIEPKSIVVEFGSGRSTPYLHEFSGDLVSFEHDLKFKTDLNDFRPLTIHGWYSLNRYDKQHIALSDVVVIDGPYGVDGGRYKMPDEIIESFKKEAIIFVDDCQREKDMAFAERIAKITGKTIEKLKGTKKIMCKIS